MTDWSFIALLSVFGILGISVLGYFAWEDYIYFKITKTAIDKALDSAKGDEHDTEEPQAHCLLAKTMVRELGAD